MKPKAMTANSPEADDRRSDRTKLVVGLGNPGAKYDNTRHNVGFEVLNEVAKKTFADSPRTKFEGQFCKVAVDETPLVLVWPLTYMNCSGQCVRGFVDFFKVDFENDVLVVCDDMSLPLGKIRLRAKGSAGGQKGLNDILRVAGSQQVGRLRVGIDQPPPGWNAPDYVLGRFPKDDRPVVDQGVATAASAVLDWCRTDITNCMNQYN